MAITYISASKDEISVNGIFIVTDHYLVEYKDIYCLNQIIKSMMKLLDYHEVRAVDNIPPGEPYSSHIVLVNKLGKAMYTLCRAVPGIYEICESLY